jgi:uncharacterized membrane protein
MKNFWVCIVISIILFGISGFFRKLSIDKINPIEFQLISAIVYTSFIPLWACLLKGKIEYNIGILFAIICSVLQIGGGIIFNLLLSKQNNTGMISALTCLSPTITLILSFLFLGEKLSINKIFAFVFALISAILVSL